MLKKILKNIFGFLNEKIFKLYLKNLYRLQIKFKFISKNDFINKKYKMDIKDYWGKHKLNINSNWHKWYSSRNGLEDVRYIPEDFYYRFIEPMYNRNDFNKAYSDKALHSLWFSDIKLPITIVKNMSGQNYDDNFNQLSHEEMIKLCKTKKQLIIKPTIESGGGKGITFVDNNEGQHEFNKLIKAVNDLEKDFVIQEVIEQHESLKKINPYSINTIRIISFYKENKVYVLSSEVMTGGGENLNSNASGGGLSCGINENGSLKKYGFNQLGKVFIKHPKGENFEEIYLPSFDEVKKLIEKIHIRLGHFKLISWDFTIDKEGFPVLIEHNLRFQGINSHQLNNGPLFGDLTEKVLNDVASEYKIGVKK